MATQLTEDTPLLQSSRTASRTVNGKAVLVLIDEQKLHTLNEVATRIWELADGRSLVEIAEVVASEFDVDRSQAIADARRFVEQLIDARALDVGATR